MIEASDNVSHKVGEACQNVNPFYAYKVEWKHIGIHLAPPFLNLGGNLVPANSEWRMGRETAAGLSAAAVPGLRHKKTRFTWHQVSGSLRSGQLIAVSLSRSYDQPRPHPRLLASWHLGCPSQVAGLSPRASPDAKQKHKPCPAICQELFSIRLRHSIQRGWRSSEVWSRRTGQPAVGTSAEEAVSFSSGYIIFREFLAQILLVFD